MSKHAILNFLITKIKGEQFYLDSLIPTAYLISLLFRKALSFFYGQLKMRRFGKFFIAPSSKLRCVSKIYTHGNLVIEASCVIDALSINGIKFGNNVSIGRCTTIECTGSLKNIGNGLQVGNNVGLGTHCFYGCAGGIEIGDNTIVGNYVSFHSENHNFDDLDIPIRLQGVNREGIKIGNNVWIGAKATILDGVIIPDGCIIAAGSVVTKNGSKLYKPNSIIAGVPGKIIKTRI